MRLYRFTLLFCALLCILGIVIWNYDSSVRGFGDSEHESRAYESADLDRSNSIRAFEKWTKSPISDDRLELGTQLARERAAAMRILMREDPDAALAAALSYAEYAKLPGEIKAIVEEPFSASGSLEVQISCGAGHDSSMHYYLKSDTGKTWQVFLPDYERVGISKAHIPLQGIRLDDAAVVRGNVFQVLQGEEADFAAANWPSGQRDNSLSYVSGLEIEGEGLTTVSGGRVYRFQNQEELHRIESALREADQLPGLHVGSQWILRELAADGFPFEQFSGEMQSAAYDTTVGAKTALFILVSFPDSPGSPVDAASLEQLIDVQVNNALFDYSYGKTSMDATIHAGPVQVSSNSGDYLGDTNGDDIQDTPKNYDDLYDEAISGYMSATGLGDPRNIYDTVGLYFTNIGYSWAGLASVGGQRMWIDGSFSDEVILHEFGHNYGLRHANYWVHDFTNANSTNPVDPGGASEEYGDDFDVMGGGSTIEGHFHMGAKQFLGWIENNEWDDLSNSSDNGTYRVHRFDDGGSSGLQAIRINKSDSGDHYWVGYRRESGGLETFEKGAYLTWELAGGNTFRNQSWLVDTTPNSSGAKEDATITLGRTYADSASDVYITPIAIGGTAPAEYIDLVVNFGPFAGNNSPSGLISGPTATDARQLVLFSASVTDPEGDPLAYSWDMGDGTVKDNSPTITHSWSVGGTYEMALTVSDMKGGSIDLTKEVTVTDPLSTWIDRTSGTTEDLNGVAANGTHVVAVGDKEIVLRSTNGETWTDVSINNLNLYLFDVIWTGAEFVAVGMDYDSGLSAWEGVIYTSPAGQSWTRAYETDLADTELNGIAYDGSSNLVAVGDSATILRKSGAGAWTSIATDITSTHVLQDVSYGDGKFVVVGHATTPSYNGDVEVRRSTEGLTWTDHSSNTGLDSWKDFREIEYVGGAFHASGHYARAQRSTNNGQNWSTTQSGDRYQLDGFAEANGVYYAVGRNRDDSDTDIDLVSNDGINWTPVDPGALADRNELIAFNDTFISVGDSGSIRQSGTVSSSEDFDSFTTTYFPGGGNDAEIDANPDSDWATNLLEYALGGHPNSNGDAPEQPIMSFDASDHAVFEITRDAKQQDVAYSVWWSQDLITWTQAGLVVVEDTATSLKVRTDQTFDQQDTAFFRLQIDQ